MRAGVVVAVALAWAGCGKSKPVAGKGVGTGLGSGAGLSALASGQGLALPVSDVVGPAVTPVAGASITFAVPKADVTWMEMSFPCYAAGATMSSGADGHPGAPIAAVSPAIPIVMAAAGIDLDTDLLAVGGFSCGERPCIYIAAHLATPEKVKDGLAAIPGVDVADLGGGHYRFAAPGASGDRTIHVRVVPVRWPAGRVADDPWNASQLRATHVVFIGGLFGGDADVDPLTLLQPPKEAAAKVAAIESLVDPTRGRCVIGHLGRQEDVKPGFVVDEGRFAVVAPKGKGDPLGHLLESDRSLDLEVELTMTPAATDADLARWIDEGRASVRDTIGPLRQQFAGQGPMVDMMFEMGGVLVDRGFKPSIAGKQVRLSWRTDRVPADALEALEQRFQSLLGNPSP